MQPRRLQEFRIQPRTPQEPRAQLERLIIQTLQLQPYQFSCSIVFMLSFQKVYQKEKDTHMGFPASSNLGIFW